MTRLLPSLLLLTLAACPEPQPQWDYSDPNHPVVYAPQPSGGGGLWQNFASGGLGYMLGRMHGRPAAQEHHYYPQPSGAPMSPSSHQPRPSGGGWFSRPSSGSSYKPAKPGFSSGGYKAPSRSGSSGFSRGGYSGGRRR